MKGDVVLLPGDVVLLSLEEKPTSFCHIIDVQSDPDCVSGIGFHVTFNHLQLPVTQMTWKLNQDHLNLGWTMGGQFMKFDLVSTPVKPVEKKKAEAVKVEDNEFI
jgi:hypothetical protein